jgi:hypothetical protein
LEGENKEGEERRKEIIRRQREKRKLREHEKRGRREDRQRETVRGWREEVRR